MLYWQTGSPDRKEDFSLKTLGRLILSAIFLGITILLAAAAKFVPGLFFSFYPQWSQQLLQKLSAVTGKLPFSVWECLVALMALWFVYSLIRVFTKRRSFFRWISGVVLAASVLAFSFVALWGLNHFSYGVAPALSLQVREYSRQELTAATQYYVNEVNRYAPLVERDENGLAVFPDFETLSAESARGYEALSHAYAFFQPDPAPVKKIMSWPLFSRFGITGIFVCLTGESCVNPDTYPAWLPYTMCHERSHRQAVAAEDEANFCGYLACMANGREDFAYSGAFGAFVYCYNALHKVDTAACAQLWSQLDDGVLADLEACNVHYAKYEGKVQDAATKVNDLYLKAFEEEDGVQSYGRAADLLIAWYLKNNT